MVEHEDTLQALDAPSSIRDKLRFIHGLIRESYPNIDRIAATLYDPQTEALKTYVDSSGDSQPLVHYQSKLSDSASLQDILRSGKPRVINDLSVFDAGEHEHTRRIRAAGYGSSYTVPIYHNQVFFGFLFFNSYQTNVFSPAALHQLDIFAHLISLVIITELSELRTLLAAVRTAATMTHFRDVETGTHLERMARYTRLIADKLAEKYDLDDEFVEHVFMFAPLHDIGKIGIPDSILLKPAELSEDEYSYMKTHTEQGRRMIDVIIENFGLESLQHTEVLRNVAELHHEQPDGGGYPRGLRHQDIPLEARIVAVADVFDALTSERPYKAAWSNDEAFQALEQMAGTELDQDCVNALTRSQAEVETIQQQFAEDRLG